MVAATVPPYPEARMRRPEAQRIVDTVFATLTLVLFLGLATLLYCGRV